ncbi:MAG: helix-turn-helix domain-containing protein [Rhodospirillaceae bacterium]|jgi:CRP/FNR family transcriptional regulator|nr:helix-turn-helix domain-containing protein [Rhodospirillaceae bacterium]MBT3491413.1 helix-turn-helix domain-containing protein [Rhodospirillaceae bacterium]MBT3782583.1 helix-turn-helix domain-containing protein [Rhodospirillaceae bacterium]MBT3974944.1 helix-turn-helix domain-containing protein [Rhodospirillaceae bacterium]MBT4167872.1 helix-turn-helix domain-containing protein [Rhodospirillaceae bacterium]
MNLTQVYEEPARRISCRRGKSASSEGFCHDCAVQSRAFCAVLSNEALTKLEGLHTLCDLAPEESLFMEGDRAASFFTVLNGCLRLSKLLPDGRRQITGFVLPGEFIGLSPGTTHAYNAEALVEANLCRFALGDLERISDENPAMKGRLLDMTNANLARAQEHMLLLGRMTALEKIASFLCNLIERASAADLSHDPLILPMSRADIADYLGLTIETVSRTFTRLKTDKLISLPEHNQVEVNDMPELRRLAEG